ALPAMLDLVKAKKISIEKVVEKMSHAVADCFQIEKRGYIREGYFADLVLVDPEKSWTVDKNNLLYKCGWSPFEGHTFSSTITHTFISGHLAYEAGKFHEEKKGMRLMFDRN
ncbi:MAG: amidohydrolase family protein, partial [Flavobacteriales bacterium]|nr:amidohydrolase family protein [Flavobacteriales bacterium]